MAGEGNDDDVEIDPGCPDCGARLIDCACGYAAGDLDEDIDDGEPCWYCHGDGGFHDCGEDCCCCLDKEEITEVCPECKGRGLL